MRLVNFNRRMKSDCSGFLDTYIDWNKQYCYDLNRKITSLYDYMIWNYPEYLIFNAPTSLSGNDDFQPYKSLVSKTEEPRLLEPYEAYVSIPIKENVSQQKSIFFPSRLNYHQGFYNQSVYGDAFLVYWEDESWRTIHQEDYLSPTYYMFEKSGESWRPQDLTLSNYNCYVENVETEIIEQTTKITLTDLNLKNQSVSVKIGLKCSDVTVTSSSNTIDIASTKYNLETGYITVTFSYPTGYTPSATPSKYITINYNQEVVTDDTKSWKLVSYPSDLFQKNTAGNLIYVGTDPCLLIHKHLHTKSGYSWIRFNLDNNTASCVVRLTKDIVSMKKTDDSYELTRHYKGDYDDLLSISDINLDLYINFPSGYVCILNKQPVGLNNDKNSIKNDLSNYLITPIGNGGYYNIWWNNDILQADYVANELNNFSNKITINLAQNCRYVNSSPSDFVFTNTTTNFVIMNWYIDNYEVRPQLVDKYYNIWTGQKDLVARICLKGETIFSDVQYDIYGSIIKQQNVHNFSVQLEKPFSFKKVDLLLY